MDWNEAWDSMFSIIPRLGKFSVITERIPQEQVWWYMKV